MSEWVLWKDCEGIQEKKRNWANRTSCQMTYHFLYLATGSSLDTTSCQIDLSN